MKGVEFYLIPDFNALMENGIFNAIYGAMGQAFFTLSIGMGGMAIFGSYIGRERSLTGEGFRVLALDTFVATMAGFPPPYKGKQNCSSALTMKKQPN